MKKIDITSKPLRLIELFAGIGSQTEALKRIGIPFEQYRVCEIDERAMKSYNAIHGTEFQTSDITKLSGSDLGVEDTEHYNYLMVYSFPCFPRGSLVLTEKGYKDISDIEVGDKVLTHNNRYETVTQTHDNGVKEVFRIKAMAVDEIKSTSNHQFYVRKMKRVGARRIRCFEDPEWKPLSELTKQYYLGAAINTKSELPEWEGIDLVWKDRAGRHKNDLKDLFSSTDFWWIVGRYMGDGWTRPGRVCISCPREETDEVVDIVKRCFHVTVSKEKTTDKLHICSTEFSVFLEQFGKGAKNKHLTDTIINLPTVLLKHFIEGYMSADGCFTHGRYSASSVSRKLIYGLAQCVAKVYNVPYSIYKFKRPTTCVIEGRTVNQNDTYQLVYKLDKRKQDKAFYDDGYVWFPIQSIESCGTENVYDLTVETDSSFTVQNTIVHNCTDLSYAGKMLGMDESSGTHSSLLWEVKRLLVEMKHLPQFLIMENVPAIVGERNIDNFNLWCGFLESLGYKNKWAMINSKDFDVPQNRKRCFMVSWLGEGDYEFPVGRHTDLKIVDILENNVDEKYFLSDEAVRCLEKHSVRDDNSCIMAGTLNDEKYKKYLDPDRRVYDELGVSPTIRTVTGGNKEIKVLVRNKKVTACSIRTRRYCGLERRLEDSNREIANTVTTVTKDSLIKIEDEDGDFRIRKLTPREYWRLMGFTDEAYDKAAAVCSKTHLYRQAGNSIVVNVLEAIFKSMMGDD